MQVGQRPNLVIGLTHTEHLDNALIRLVDAVLCTSVTLCYPETLSLLRQDVANVVTQMTRREVEVAHRSSALYAKHLVALANVDDQWRRHEVGSKRNLRRVVSILIEDIL